MLTKIGTKLNKNNKYRDQIIDFDMWHAAGLIRGHLKKFKKKIQKNHKNDT